MRLSEIEKVTVMRDGLQVLRALLRNVGGTVEYKIELHVGPDKIAIGKDAARTFLAAQIDAILKDLRSMGVEDDPQVATQERAA